MSMLDLTKAELESHKALTPSLNQITKQVVNAISYPTVDQRMKAVIATAQISNFAAQFKRNLVLWDDTEVPINSISFVITGSGAGKDSSVKAARKCFKPGFELIEAARKKSAKQAAINLAREADEEAPEEFDVYKAYLKPVPPIDIMPTTGPGLIQHVNDIGDLELSSGFLYSGEFSDELAYNQDMMENIKILSELYDLGDKEAKYTKGVEHRSKSINGQPVSALFVGSPGHILYDDNTKKKFHVAFMSKLARRSWFCYTPDRIPEPVFDSMQDLWDYEESIEIKAKQARATMEDLVTRVTKFGLSTDNKPITVSEDVFKLFKTYKRYNNDLVDSLPNQDSTYALIRRHLQWKALKLAGAYALFDQKDEVSKYHYIEAIQFCELLDKDMLMFEHDLNKADHERFSDFIRTEVDHSGKAIVSIHDLKKKGFVSSVSTSKLQELVTLCAGYDTQGIYSVINEGGAIQYEPVLKTDVLGVSFKPIDCSALDAAVESGDSDAIRNAKHNISVTTAYGYEVGETTFEELSDLLTGSFAYSPFRFKDGIRRKENIYGGTKWLVLDIDDTPISAEECHFMLSDINHHIALSSDPNNQFKYRVIIELDASVELDSTSWKHFYLAIASDLALHVDPLPQSQIYYAYPNRDVYSTLDAEPLVTRDYIMAAKEKSSSKSYTPTTTAQKRALLSDPLTTFAYAFDAPDGVGSRNIIRAMYHLRDLGGTQENALELFEAIQNYWPRPFEPTRAEAMINQIKGLF